MKNIRILFTFLFATLFFSQEYKAQAFQKGNINVDIGIGLGIYGTTQTIKNEISFKANGVSYNQTSVHDTTDGAGSTIIPIAFEYGLSNKFGVGLDLTSSSYFISEEDRKVTSSVKSFDFGVKVNYHLLNSEKNDLLIGLGFGMSKVSWKFKNVANNIYGLSSASGSGTYLSLGITDRIFFSDHFGILFNLGYRAYSYPEINYEATNSSAALTALGVSDFKFTQELDWSLKGIHFGTGIALKF